MNYSAGITAEVRAEMGRQRYAISKLATVTRIPVSRLHRRLNHPHLPFNTDELVLVAGALGVSLADLVQRAEQRAA